MIKFINNFVDKIDQGKIMNHSKNISLNRRERKIIKSKEKILEVAEQLFKERSIDDVSVEEISENADFSKGTIYNYFINKEGIYFRIGVKALKNINVEMAKLFTKKINGREILEQLIINNMRGRHANPLYNEITIKFLSIEKENVNRILEEYLEEFRTFTDYWKEAIELGVRDGSIKKTKQSLNEIIQYIFVMINGIVSYLDSNSLFHRTDELTLDISIDLTLKLINNFLIE